jgi:hypothetical protein
MSLLNISCKKATYLVSKKEQGRINLFDRITLQMHLGICSLCKRFEQQTGFIIKNTKHTHTEEKLSDEVKDRIKEALDSGY